MVAARHLLQAGIEQVRDDLRSDRYLRYILLLAAILSGFWFWHRIPNFATRDEFTRLLDVLVAYGAVIEEPSLEALREGITWGRAPFGATFYLFGLAVLPVVALALLVGQGAAIAALFVPDPAFGFYSAWHGTPAWIWTGSIIAVRLVNVAFAVGCVYLTYRLGVDLADRNTGRLASLLLTLTFGFLTIAHEGGEDMPATFLVLLVLVLLVRYVKSGRDELFFAASGVGGLALGFKLTAAPVVVLIGVAHLRRMRSAGEGSLRERFRPRFVAIGAAIGFAVIVLSFPTALVGEIELVADRIGGESLSRANRMTGPSAPVAWWFLRGYGSALGLPLLVASVVGVAASFRRLRRRPPGFETGVLVLTGLAAYLLLFSGWHDFRVHHLLPTFPLLALLLAWPLVRFRERSPALAQSVIAILLVTTAVYAGVGVGGYAAMPRDQATDWLNEHAENETMEVYRVHFQDTAVPHQMDIRHEFDGESVRCPKYVQLGYRDLLYLRSGTYYRNGEIEAEYIRNLLDGTYGYELVAEFGTRPPDFVPQRPTPGSYADLVRHGIVPQTDQYADEQELAGNQYTAILELTGECDRTRRPPF